MADNQKQKRTIEDAIHDGIDEVDQTIRQSGKKLADKIIEKVTEAIAIAWDAKVTDIKYKIMKGLNDGKQRRQNSEASESAGGTTVGSDSRDNQAT